VETAAIELMYHTLIRQDKKLDSLLGITEQQKTAKARKAASRSTRLLLGVRGALGGIDLAGNELVKANSQVEATPLFPEQGYSVYFGTNNTNSLLGFQIEANFYLNTGMKEEQNGKTRAEFSYNAVDIPFLLRLGFAEGGMFSLFGGPYISIPLSKLSYTYNNGSPENLPVAQLLNFMGSFGILGGMTFGFKLGPGYIALDGRYTYDFTDIAYVTEGHKNTITNLFRRRGFKIGLGYELWL
jgi:hypothetical protein